MTEDNAPPRGIPVVIDEWLLQLWADSKVSAAEADRLVALIDAELDTTALTLTARLTEGTLGSGAERVTVEPRPR